MKYLILILLGVKRDPARKILYLLRNERKERLGMKGKVTEGKE
jgi:hypothetical protein